MCVWWWWWWWGFMGRRWQVRGGGTGREGDRPEAGVVVGREGGTRRWLGAFWGRTCGGLVACHAVRRALSIPVTLPSLSLHPRHTTMIQANPTPRPVPRELLLHRSPLPPPSPALALSLVPAGSTCSSASAQASPHGPPPTTATSSTSSRDAGCADDAAGPSAAAARRTKLPRMESRVDVAPNGRVGSFRFKPKSMLRCLRCRSALGAARAHARARIKGSRRCEQQLAPRRAERGQTVLAFSMALIVRSTKEL